MIPPGEATVEAPETFIDPRLLTRQRVRNGLHSVALLLGMAGHAALLGWVFGGPFGVALALVFAVASLALALGASSRMALRLWGARELAPFQAPGLHRLTEALAERAGLPPPTLHYIPSAMPNALSIGTRGEVALALTDGLLRLLSPRELTAVLAHELGHVRQGDVLVMSMAAAFVRYTTVLGQIGLVLLPLAVCFGDLRVVLLALVLVGGPTWATLMQLALSRQREYLADLQAVELTGDPAALASALRRLEQPRRLWERLVGAGTGEDPSMLRTHPATEDRIARLEKLRADVRRLEHPEVRIADALPPVAPRPRWWRLDR